MIQRRGLLAGILASGFAPAAIGSGILMPVRALALPWPFTETGGIITWVDPIVRLDVYVRSFDAARLVHIVEKSDIEKWSVLVEHLN